MRQGVFLITTVTAALAWTILPAQQTYRIVRIPGLGGQDTRARAINGRGDVVGTATLEGDTETRGFLYDGSRTVLLQGLTPEAASTANGINETGDIVGQSIDPDALKTSPVLWRGDELIDLGITLRCEGGTALDVNDSGVVVGMAAVDSPFSKGFIWDAEAGGRMVGTLEGRNGGANRAINNDGIVVGDSFFFGDPGQAHLVGPGEHDYETRPIGPPPPYSGVAWSVNNVGIVVGMAAPTFSPHTAVIFTVDAEEPLIELGTLPGATSSVAFGVNDSGVIVGSSGDHPDWVSGHAFVVLNGTMHDLNDLIIDASDEWKVLIEATAINNRGEIVGWGETRDGQISGFLLLTSHGTAFRRGDCNDDGKVDISDSSCILGWLFLGEAEPGCVAVTDTNGDGAADLSDAVYLLTYLFLGGPSPVTPFPDCGQVPEDEALACETPPESCQ